MTEEKVILCVRIDKTLADKIELIARGYTRPGEQVNTSVAIREAIRQFVNSNGS